MQTPVHNFKNFWRYDDKSKPPHWTQDAHIGWLGSGKKDKNGKEIFEGDIVDKKTGFCDEHIRTIAIFRWCGFDLIREEDWNVREHCGAYSLGLEHPSYLEVVGHIAE